MRIVCIIQARMSSTRLPNKVLIPLAGREVLSHILQRLSFCKTLDEIIVATSTDNTDDELAEWCLQRKVMLFRGSLNDVLDRYYQCALIHNADAVVRITGDCPAIDPNIVDDVVKGFSIKKFDLFYLGGNFPDGLDCAVFSFGALEKAWKEAMLPSEREHVGPYIVNNPKKFKIGSIEKFNDLGHHRWTLDEPRDLEFLQAVFEYLYDKELPPFSSKDILDLMKREPKLLKINQNILRNEGLIKSLAEDKKKKV